MRAASARLFPMARYFTRARELRSSSRAMDIIAKGLLSESKIVNV